MSAVPPDKHSEIQNPKDERKTARVASAGVVGRASRLFQNHPGSCSRSARCVSCCSAWLASIPQHAPARGPSCSLLHALKLPEHPPTRPSFGFLFSFFLPSHQHSDSDSCSPSLPSTGQLQASIALPYRRLSTWSTRCPLSFIDLPLLPVCSSFPSSPSLSTLSAHVCVRLSNFSNILKCGPRHLTSERREWC